MITETEDSIRLRKAKEFLAKSKELENEARRELARAVEQTALAKRKHDELFLECETRAVEKQRNHETM